MARGKAPPSIGPKSHNKPEPKGISDAELARSVMKESELKETALKEDVTRLRNAAKQLDRLVTYLELLNDERARTGLTYDLSEMAAYASNLASVKVREVQTLILARRDMTHKDLNREGGRFNGGTSMKGWGS